MRKTPATLNKMHLLSTSGTLEAIWEDFKVARSNNDLARMELCLREHELEYNSVALPNGGPQREMARRRVMKNRINRFNMEDERISLAGEGW